MGIQKASCYCTCIFTCMYMHGYLIIPLYTHGYLFGDHTYTYSSYKCAIPQCCMSCLKRIKRACSSSCSFIGNLTMRGYASCYYIKSYSCSLHVYIAKVSSEMFHPSLESQHAQIH